MSKIKIVTDSSLTIEPELVEKYDITVVPLSVMIDGVVYSDNDMKEEGKFLNLMRNSKELPKTSQPPVGVFAEVYENLMKDGAEHIVSIHITHTLSGTVEAARQGANLAGADVTVIDSTFTDQCQKFQVVQAAKLAQEGASLEEVIAKVEEVRQKSELFIGVSTLENLVKRINAEGLDFGIWFEPEMISPESRLYEEHPDWAFTVPGRVPGLARNQLVLDISREEVADYIFEKMAKAKPNADDPEDKDVKASKTIFKFIAALKTSEGNLFEETGLTVKETIHIFMDSEISRETLIAASYVDGKLVTDSFGLAEKVSKSDKNEAVELLEEETKANYRSAEDKAEYKKAICAIGAIFGVDVSGQFDSWTK